MTPKLQGRFRGCPHHGDDYEACIQYSGTAPCGVEEERDALAAHRYRTAHYVFRYRCGHFDAEALADAMLALDSVKPNTSLARQKLLWQAGALEQASSEMFESPEHADWLYEQAQDLRRRAEELDHETRDDRG